MRALFRRLRARIKYWNHAAELRRELDVHRAMAEAGQAGDAVDARDARWRAARLLGNSTLAREEARRVWVAPWRDHLRQDVRYAVRTLWRDRGFTVTAPALPALFEGFKSFRGKGELFGKPDLRRNGSFKPLLEIRGQFQAPKLRVFR